MNKATPEGDQGATFERYRMTGSASDAEDLVQEAYLRSQASEPAAIVSPQGYLILTSSAANFL